MSSDLLAVMEMQAERAREVARILEAQAKAWTVPVPACVLSDFDNSRSGS